MTSLSQLAEVLSADDIIQLKEEIYNEVLRRNTNELCKKIVPERHFPLLRQKNVFTLSIEQEILAPVTTKNQVRKFIDELTGVGGATAFPAFIESIDKTQVDLKKRLNKCCEALKEDIPPEILAKLETRVQLEDLHREEAVMVYEDDIQPEGFPEIDMERLIEAQESYDRYPTEDQEKEDEDELVEIVDLPILKEEPKMNQL